MAIVAGLIAFTILAGSAANFDPQIDGFGANWRAFETVEFDGRLIKGMNSADVVATGLQWQQQGYKVFLWLGASQLHTISAAQDGQTIAVAVANAAAARKGLPIRYVQVSNGNANLYEMLGVYLEVTQAGFHPDGVILGMTYDDLREPGVRGSIYPKITDELLAIGGPGVANLRAEMIARNAVPATAPVVRNAMNGTPQQTLEKSLVNYLDAHWTNYAYRERLKGMLQISWKQKVARVVLGSERRASVVVDKADEDYNMLALQSLARIAQSQGTKLWIYRAPVLHKSDFSYYVAGDYERFTAALVEYCRASGIAFLDLDHLVPDSLFGLTNSDLPDYFHFAAAGHELLGSAIQDWTTEQGQQ